MAITFHSDVKNPSRNLVKCSLHLDKHGCYYIDMDGYYVMLPSVRTYSECVELLIIMQGFFEKGFTFIDCSNK